MNKRINAKKNRRRSSTVEVMMTSSNCESELQCNVSVLTADLLVNKLRTISDNETKEVYTKFENINEDDTQVFTQWNINPVPLRLTKQQCCKKKPQRDKYQWLLPDSKVVDKSKVVNTRRKIKPDSITLSLGNLAKSNVFPECFTRGTKSENSRLSKSGPIAKQNIKFEKNFSEGPSERSTSTSPPSTSSSRQMRQRHPPYLHGSDKLKRSLLFENLTGDPESESLANLILSRMNSNDANYQLPFSHFEVCGPYGKKRGNQPNLLYKSQLGVALAQKCTKAEKKFRVLIKGNSKNIVENCSNNTNRYKEIPPSPRPRSKGKVRCKTR